MNTPPSQMRRIPGEDRTRHALRNGMAVASLSITLARRALDNGDMASAKRALDDAMSACDQCSRHLGVRPRPLPSSRASE